VVASNTSEVVNGVDIDANTGRNQVNGNTGEGVVETGAIYSEVNLATEMNGTVVKVCEACGFGGTVTAMNEKTGAGSENVSEVVVNKSTNVEINQESSVNNQVSGSFNTGDNQANGNTEGGRIETGGISLTLDIGNVLNKAVVILEGGGCCGVEDPGDPGDPEDPGDPGTGGPEEPSPPSDNPGSSSGTSSSGGSSSSGNSGGGSVAAASIGPAIGAILPATGAKLWLWWMAGLFLFSMGRFVRLMAGRSPAVARVEA
jgi:uncharacterized membrane protein YgcG